MNRPWLIGVVVLGLTALTHFGYYYIVRPEPACGETPGQMWKATGPRPPPASVNAPITERYVRDRLYLMGLSYGMALGFTAYAAAKSRRAPRQGGVAGVIGGLSLTGFLATAGCFLLGCCGSPMLTVYLALFGSALAGLKDVVVFVLTIISVLLGLLWMRRCRPAGGACCASGCGCGESGRPESP